MTIDEAIQYAEDLGKEEENKIDYDKDSPHTITRRKNTVKDYRQLAEWLKELKELKSSIGAVKLELLKEAQAELEKRGNMLHDAIAELEKAKRLLKEAVNDFHWLAKWHDDCELCGSRYDNGDCPVDECRDCDDVYKWRHETEALKLIGEEDMVLDGEY